MKYINDPSIVKNDDGVRHYTSAIPVNSKQEFITYTYVTRAGDRWDTLAYKYLGNPKYWYILANANNRADGSIFIEQGTTITIPQL